MIGTGLILGLTSCTNELGTLTPDNLNPNKNISLVHAPDVTAWSGSQILGSNNSFGKSRAATDANVVSWSQCSTTTIDRNKEAEFIETKLKENGNNFDDIDFDFLFYSEEDAVLQFYPVYSKTSTPNDLGLFYFDENGDIHEMIIWAAMNPNSLWENNYDGPWDTVDPVTGDWYRIKSHGVQITIKAGYKFGFYWKGNLNSGETTYYSISEKNEEVKVTDGGGNPISPETYSKVHAGTFVHNGQTYLCLEDWTDFDYQDWVFTCNAALKTSNSDEKTPKLDEEQPETPEQPTPPVDNNDKCPKCGHDSHDDDCPDCTNPEDGCYPEQPEPEQPEQPGPEQPEEPTPGEDAEEVHNNEVEVNLSINDSHNAENRYDDSDLWSKLSIHVRKGTDVEIHMPVPATFFCESDDFAIVESHQKNLGSYTGDEDAKVQLEGTKHTMTYTIENWTVTLSIEFVTDDPDHQYGCIVVRTEGITQELIDYLFENNGDGINFEIWTYFQTEYKDENGNVVKRTDVSRNDLAYWLNKSTVEFLDEEPDYYINAFGSIEDNVKTPGDCTVTIVGRQVSDYGDGYERGHLNGSGYNMIYVRKGVTPDKAHDRSSK